METLLYLAPLSGFPFAHEALTWMGSTVTVGSEGAAGYEFRIPHRFLPASSRPIYLAPKMVTFRDRLASARCPRRCSLVATVPLRRLVSRHHLAFHVGDAGEVKAAQWCVHQP